MAPGARFEILQVEAEQVVALDHVGVALGDDPHQLLKHRALVHRVAAQHALIARRIAERDCDHAVALARRGRELEAGTDVGFDIELHPAQLAEFHPDEKRDAAQDEVLFDRVREHQVGGVRNAGRFAGELAQMAPRSFQRIKAVEGRKPSKTEVAFQRLYLVRRTEPVEHPGLRQQREELERMALAREGGADAAENLDLGRSDDLDRHDSGFGRVTKEQPVVVKLPADLVITAHRGFRAGIVARARRASQP